MGEKRIPVLVLKLVIQDEYHPEYSVILKPKAEKGPMIPHFLSHI